jgi:hypothetical protein
LVRSGYGFFPVLRPDFQPYIIRDKPRKAMREMVDNNMQKVGMREDKEKKTYELYTSRERYYNEQLNGISVWVVSSVRKVHTMNVSKSTQL